MKQDIIMYGVCLALVIAAVAITSLIKYAVKAICEKCGKPLSSTMKEYIFTPLAVSLAGLGVYFWLRNGCEIQSELSGLCACGHFDDDRLSRRVSADAQNRGKDRAVGLPKNRSSESGATFKGSERKQGYRSRRYCRRSKASKGDAERLSVSPSEARRRGERTSSRNDLVRRPSDRRRAPRRYFECNQKHS